MGMEKPIPTGFLDEAAWLAPLKSVQDPRLNHLAGRKELRALQEILSALVRSTPHGNRRLEAYHVLILHLLGFDHTRLTYRFQGRDFRLTDVSGEVVKRLLA